MEYKIVEGFTFTMLEEEVARLLKDGWQPLGGVSVSDTQFRSVMFYQAMIRYVKKGIVKKED